MSGFSIEAIVLGRNDDYEPNWTAKLYASLAYNRRLFEGSRVDFRVAFVEWNPPKGKPLLAPSLLERFPFVRAIVVDAEIHEELCESNDLQMMINFPYNSAIRSGSADFNLITAGDEFFGLALSRRIIEGGLREGCLYRAERVNVREDLNFGKATADLLELPENLVSIDASSEPPYTNACGDFLMLDAAMMAGIRGMDESVRNARLHLDSRFAMNAMIAGADCELLGQIFHINHRTSFRNSGSNYPGQTYKWDVGLPYINPLDWGLASYNWDDSGGRMLRVSVPMFAKAQAPPNGYSRDADARAAAVSEHLAVTHARTQPEAPGTMSATASTDIDVLALEAPDHWGTKVKLVDGVISFQTSPTQWGFAATIPLDGARLAQGQWHWLLLKLAISEGAIGVGFTNEALEVIGERYVFASNASEQIVPVPSGAQSIMFRNIAAAGVKSTAAVYSAKLLSQDRIT